MLDDGDNDDNNFSLLHDMLMLLSLFLDPAQSFPGMCSKFTMNT